MVFQAFWSDIFPSVKRFSYRVCGKPYNGSTLTKFRSRANNYKSTHRDFRKEQKLSNQSRNEKRFHERYLQNDHNGACDQKVTITNHAETEKSLRRKGLPWHHELKTYAPVSIQFAIRLLFLVIVIVIVKNDYSHRTYFLNIFQYLLLSLF